MKKLTTLLEELGSIDASSYSNIQFEGATLSDKVNLSLLKDINNAAKSSGIKVTISSIVTGHRELTSSGQVSRHKTGEAVDISRVNGVGWSSKSDAQSKNILSSIESFVTNLKNDGYAINSESNNSKSVLYFGFPDHENHIHISNKTSGSSNTGTSDDDSKKNSPTSYARDYLIKSISGLVKPMFGLNESKERRVLLNIDKIKNLLK
jgi:hypothetical protein